MTLALPHPRLSVVLQYFRIPANIHILSRWSNCASVELLVNVDSRTAADLAWLNTSAEHIVFSRNIHEIRAYNRLAGLARGALLAFVQDDESPPTDCEYLDKLEQMFSDDPHLAVVGSNVWTNTPGLPRGHVWNGIQHTRNGAGHGAPLWHGGKFRASYAACVDIGPLYARRAAFLSLGGFDEGLSLPGQAGIYLDYELSLRAWIRGYTVAALATRGRADGLTKPQPARQHWKSKQAGELPTVNTTEVLGADGSMRIFDETGEPIDSPTSHVTRFRAWNGGARPKVSRHRDALIAHYKPWYDNISSTVASLNQALRDGEQQQQQQQQQQRQRPASRRGGRRQAPAAHRRLAPAANRRRVICPCSFGPSGDGTACDKYRLPSCDIYEAKASAMEISLAPDHWPCDCLRELQGARTVLPHVDMGDDASPSIYLARAIARCNETIDTSCAHESCSGHGLCTSDRFPRRSIHHPLPRCVTPPCTCACIAPWSGKRCEIRTEVRCLRNCSQHGRCTTQGYCVCDAGYSGIDCHPDATTTAASASHHNGHRRPTPQIYIYDRCLPEDAHTFTQRELPPAWSRCKSCRRTPQPCPALSIAEDGIYRGGDAFFSRLLRDERHRTYDPAAADLFLLPLERGFVHNTYDVLASKLVKHWLTQWLLPRAKGPLHRHVWLLSTDQCAAFGSDMSFDAFADWFRPHGGVVMCHYGLPHRAKKLLTNGTRGGFVILPGSSPQADLQGDDLDPWTQTRAVQQAARAYGRQPPPQQHHHQHHHHQPVAVPTERRLKLLFWGSVRLARAPEQTRRCVAAPKVSNPACEGLYSRGIRQVLWSLFANHSFADFRSELPSLAAQRKPPEKKLTYYQALLSTEYCLDAPGNGFGVRLVDYMVSGCIPVLVNNSLWAPFESVVPYATFAHIFALDDAHTVVETLLAESDADRRARRSVMASHYRKFLWDEQGGEAYQVTLAELAQYVQSSE